jgi:hypothetical protein
MSDWTQWDRHIGIWSAAGVAATVVVYVIVGLIGVAVRPPGANLLSQVDPYLAILEVLLSLAALDLIVLMAAIYAYAPSDRKTLALAALAFTVAFAILTCGAHFASLTAGRQLDPAASPLLSRHLSFGKWPSLAMSVDLLAWDFFLGLAMIFASRVFQGGGIAAAVRVSMIVAGILCLIGALAPTTGQLQIQYVGIAGYILALPAACTLVALLFGRARVSAAS